MAVYSRSVSKGSPREITHVKRVLFARENDWQGVYGIPLEQENSWFAFRTQTLLPRGEKRRRVRRAIETRSTNNKVKLEDGEDEPRMPS